MNIDFSKYKRIFAFGCSLTNWCQPTWVHLIEKMAPDAEIYNLGLEAAGNMFIASRMTQANRTFDFCETDLVMTMWSTHCREDRFMEGSWKLSGNIFTALEPFDGDYAEKFADPVGYLARDLSIIDLVTSYMNSLPCDYIGLISVPPMYQILDREDPIYKNIVETYSKLIDSLPTPLVIALDGNWNVGPPLQYRMNGKLIEDYHPHILSYAMYFKKIGIPISDDVYNYASDLHEQLKTVKEVSEFEERFSDTLSKPLRGWYLKED